MTHGHPLSPPPPWHTCPLPPPSPASAPHLAVHMPPPPLPPLACLQSFFKDCLAINEGEYNNQLGDKPYPAHVETRTRLWPGRIKAGRLYR